MIKNSILLLLVVVIGIVGGFVLALVQVKASSARTSLLPEELVKRSPENGPIAREEELLPKAVVDNEVFDFGTMDKSAGRVVQGRLNMRLRIQHGTIPAHVAHHPQNRQKRGNRGRNQWS